LTASIFLDIFQPTSRSGKSRMHGLQVSFQPSGHPFLTVPTIRPSFSDHHAEAGHSLQCPHLLFRAYHSRRYSTLSYRRLPIRSRRYLFLRTMLSLDLKDTDWPEGLPMDLA
jgi:hypothetical protein